MIDLQSTKRLYRYKGGVHHILLKSELSIVLQRNGTHNCRPTRTAYLTYTHARTRIPSNHYTRVPNMSPSRNTASDHGHVRNGPLHAVPIFAREHGRFHGATCRCPHFIPVFSPLACGHGSRDWERGQVATLDRLIGCSRVSSALAG